MPRKGSGVLGPVRQMFRGVRRRPVLSLLVGLVVSAAGAAVGANVWALYHYRAAEEALTKDRYADARRHIARCLFVWSKSPDAHLLAARVERSSGDYPAAEKQLNEVKRLQPGATEETQLEWLLLRAQQGEVDEVAPALWACVNRRHPQAVRILETLARTYMHELRYRPARACLDRWLEIDPEAVRALDWRGWVRERLESPFDAVDDYRRALELAPGRSALRLRLVEVLLDKQNPQAAWVHLRRLRAEDVDNPEVMIALARYRMLQGKFVEACSLLDRALAARPQDAAALYYRGKVELHRGQPPRAEGWFRRAVERDPYDLEKQNGLYESLRQQGARKEAAAAVQRERCTRLKDDLYRLKNLLRREIEAAPRSPGPPSEAGAILLRLGQAPLGLHWLFEALQRDRRHRPTHAILARYYRQNGQPAKAAEHRHLAGKP